MKKKLWIIIALIAALLVGCNKAEAPATVPETTAATEAAGANLENLQYAADYLKGYYMDVTVETPGDYERITTVRVGLDAYTITWSVDAEEEYVKVVVGEDGKVLIDVNENSDKEVPYVLTATITDADGNSLDTSWNHILPGYDIAAMQDIVDQAYAMEVGASLQEEVTLQGVVTNIDTPWDSNYKNISVVMEIEGREDKPILCYRLKGDGAENLVIGDTITVTGIIKNYKGTIEFDSGCRLMTVIKTGTPIEIPEDPAQIMQQAWSLAPGESLPYNCTLSGKIITVDTPYSEQYDNITVTILVEKSYGYTVQCFRLSGDEVETLNVNDIITVTGQIKNYNGVIEFNLPKLNSVIQKSPPEKLTSAHDIVAAAYKMSSNMTLPYKYTLTGKVTNVKYEWSEKYGNVSLTLTVQHCDYCKNKPIFCHQMTGNTADLQNVEVGDTITVSGYITNYLNRNYGTNTIEYNKPTLVKLVKNTAVAPEDPKQIVDEAFALEENESLDYKATLTGKITDIKTAYDSYYKNITVIMEVEGSDGMKKLECYRLKGDGAADLCIGDTITVTGTISNYKGTIEYVSGCTLDKVVPGDRVQAPSDPKQIVDAAFALEEGAKLPYQATLTGEIVTIDEAYSSQYGNITVSMEVAGSNDMKTLKCYRLKGDGADTLAVGDTITVTGYIKNHYGTVEFDSGCILDNVVKGEGGSSEPDVPEENTKTLAEQLAEAAELSNGEYLSYETTIEGKVSRIKYAYDATYENISFYVDVNGTSVYCYRMKGEGVATLAVGDTVKVVGNLSAYSGNAQFNGQYGKASVTVLEKAENSSESDTTKTLEEQLAEAANLGDNEYLSYETTIEGKVSRIKYAYDATYENISFYVDVNGTSVYCYRMKGEGVATLAVGDTVKVVGNLSAYSGNAQFNGQYGKASVTVLEKAPTAPSNPQEIVDAAFALEKGAFLPYTVTLTGEISEINTPYDSGYKNITVTIQVEGSTGMKDLLCYRMDGTGADSLEIGDVITVSGTIKNYNGTIEFDSGCDLVSVN